MDLTLLLWYKRYEFSPEDLKSKKMRTKRIMKAARLIPAAVIKKKDISGHDFSVKTTFKHFFLKEKSSGNQYRSKVSEKKLDRQLIAELKFSLI